MANANKKKTNSYSIGRAAVNVLQNFAKRKP